MTNLRVSAKSGTIFWGCKIVFAAAANLPQTPTHIRRKDNRKYRRKPAINRKAAGPRNCPLMTRAMAQKHRPAKSFLLPFGKSSE
jgi:hypothetical protein